MKLNISNLKKIITESTKEDFIQIVSRAYPWIEKTVKKLIVDLYTAEGWYPDDPEELKSDLPEIVNAHATPGIKKIIMAAIEKTDDDDEEDYDEGHAQEWMERHPHGWYNNEHDYGTGDEEDDADSDTSFYDLGAEISRTLRDEMPVDENNDSLTVVDEAERGGIGYNQNKSDLYIQKMQRFVDTFGINEFFDLIADNLSPRAFDDGVQKWLHPFASRMGIQESCNKRSMKRKIR